MAGQFLPIIKAVAPYLAQIVATAIPTFTSRAAAAKADPDVARQIAELQDASTQNAQSIHLLAEKMQETIQGLEAAAREARQQVVTSSRVALLALAIAGLALALSFYLLLR
jgi:predicted PurR-regulated permease PerM